MYNLLSLGQLIGRGSEVFEDGTEKGGAATVLELPLRPVGGGRGVVGLIGELNEPMTS